MIRRVLIAAALAGAAIVVPATPAQALYPCAAGNYCLHTWYTDNTRTKVNGVYSVNCEGTQYRSGTLQGYLVFSARPCNDPPPEV